MANDMVPYGKDPREELSSSIIDGEFRVLDEADIPESEWERLSGLGKDFEDLNFSSNSPGYSGQGDPYNNVKENLNSGGFFEEESQSQDSSSRYYSRPSGDFTEEELEELYRQAKNPEEKRRLRSIIESRKSDMKYASKLEEGHRKQKLAEQKRALESAKAQARVDSRRGRTDPSKVAKRLRDIATLGGPVKPVRKDLYIASGLSRLVTPDKSMRPLNTFDPEPLRRATSLDSSSGRRLTRLSSSTPISEASRSTGTSPSMGIPPINEIARADASRVTRGLSRRLNPGSSDKAPDTRYYRRATRKIAKDIQ